MERRLSEELGCIERKNGYHDWKKEFHVHVDVSCIALGAVLTQVGGGELDHPIAFPCRRLSKAKKNYSTTEREGLAMVYGVQKFREKGGKVYKFDL